MEQCVIYARFEYTKIEGLTDPPSKWCIYSDLDAAVRILNNEGWEVTQVVDFDRGEPFRNKGRAILLCAKR